MNDLVDCTATGVFQGRAYSSANIHADSEWLRDPLLEVGRQGDLQQDSHGVALRGRTKEAYASLGGAMVESDV